MRVVLHVPLVRVSRRSLVSQDQVRQQAKGSGQEKSAVITERSQARRVIVLIAHRFGPHSWA